jgi:hypothetical protein
MRGMGFDVLDLVGGDIVVTFPCLLLYFEDRFGLLLCGVAGEPSGGKIYLGEETLLPYLRVEQILGRHTFPDDVRGQGVLRSKGEVNSKYQFSVNRVDYTKVTRRWGIKVVHLVVKSGIWERDSVVQHERHGTKISVALDLDGRLL